ncbi:MAG: NTP transferase domain-containing protein [Proteobacteria bacterium]|nr:NTP transferase domain-containing protein [Pseudomonadota bacterium]
MNKHIMHGIVLAAGLGRRLEQITEHIPKPMIKLNEIALIDHAILSLVKIGVQVIFINTHYKFDALQNFIARQIAEKKYRGAIIKFSYEEQILETGGAIFNGLRNLNVDDILVINADIMMPDSDLSPLVDNWGPHCDVLSLVYDKHRLDYTVDGDFDLNKQNQLIPNRGGRYIWMGAYRLRRVTLAEYFGRPVRPFSIMDVVFYKPQKTFLGISYQKTWIDAAGILEVHYKHKLNKWGQTHDMPELQISAGPYNGAIELNPL